MVNGIVQGSEDRRPLEWRHNERDGVSNHRCFIDYSTICSGADQRKHQSSPSLAFVRGIHRWPVNSLHKVPVTWKIVPFDDVIMQIWYTVHLKNYIHHSPYVWLETESRFNKYVVLPKQGSYISIMGIHIVIRRLLYTESVMRRSNIHIENSW